MAIVTEIKLSTDGGRRARHPTQVEAVVRVFGDAERDPILQIDTFGSKDRQMPGKLSQTVQFDARAARELFDILQATFKF